MAQATTIKREAPPTVMIIGAAHGKPPAYVEALLAEDYEVVAAKDAEEARAAMGIVMPHVILMSRSLPMSTHPMIYDIAKAVAAHVIFTPDDANPELVRAEVEIAIQKVKRRREQA